MPPLSLSWLVETRLLSLLPAPAKPPDAVDAAAPGFAATAAAEEPPPVTVAAAAPAGGGAEEEDDKPCTNPSLSLDGAFSTEDEAATAPPGLSPIPPPAPGCAAPLAGGGSIAFSPDAAACRP